MNFKSSLLALCAVALFAACDKSEESPTPSPTPNPTPEPSANYFEGAIFGTTITNPDGASGSCYMQAISDLTPATYNNSQALPTGFGAPIIVQGKSVYVFPDYMGMDKAVITRYSIDSKKQFKKEGELMLPGGAAACNLVQLSAEKAYLSLQNLGVVWVFNPQTMTKTNEIDLNKLAHDNTRVSPASMVLRDGYLFVGLSQMDGKWMPTQKMAEVALIDTNTDKFVKNITETKMGVAFATRPIDPHSIFVDEVGDIYINCIGSFGFMPDYKAGILRIRKGETEFDPNYSILLPDTKIEGLDVSAEFLASVRYGGNGKLYAYANAYQLDPAGMSNPYTVKSSVPVMIDLKERTIHRLTDLPISNPHAIAVGMLNNKVVFGSANEKAAGFYLYDPATKKSEGPVIRVQGNPYNFNKY